MTRMEELRATFRAPLHSFKVKNREHVRSGSAEAQYKQPYAKNWSEHQPDRFCLCKICAAPPAGPESRMQMWRNNAVINQMIQTSGMLKKISSCMSKTYDVGQIYPLILELRHMVEQALWPYVNQATCLVADLDDIEKEPTIYNFLTHEVYENDTWIHREIDLRWKLLVHLTPEQRESVPPANHSMNGGIYHERTTI